MKAQKKHRNRHHPVLFSLLFILGLGLDLLPQALHAKTLRIVYSNDNLGELAPCG